MQSRGVAVTGLFNGPADSHRPTAPVGTGTIILNDHIRFVGRGRAADARLALQIKLTINAQGVVIQDRVVAREICN